MAKLVIDANRKLSKINKEIQGQFSEHLGRCIYEGLYVGENSDIPNVNGMRTDVVEALKNIKVPVLRWPGGCFADEYHWKDGIGPKESRKKMINTNWGGVVEDNSFGTHEFFELCRQIGCETEKQIQHSLRELDFPCTKVIIAQRISTTKTADKIIVLQNGYIKEMGTHEELMEKKGYYYELVKLQTGVDEL